MWPCAVPIPPACDNRAKRAFPNLDSSASTFQRPTLDVQRRDGCSVVRERERLVRWRSRLAIVNFSDHLHTIPGFPPSFSARALKRTSAALALSTILRPSQLIWFQARPAATPVVMSRSARPLFYIHNMLSRWFVDGADDRACDCELDHSAGDPAEKDFERQWLDRERD